MLQRIREAACRPERYGDPMIKPHETLAAFLVKTFTSMCGRLQPGRSEADGATFATVLPHFMRVDGR